MTLTPSSDDVLHDPSPEEACWVAAFTPMRAAPIVDLAGASDGIVFDLDSMLSDEPQPADSADAALSVTGLPGQNPVASSPDDVDTGAFSRRAIAFRTGVGALFCAALVLAAGRFDYRTDGNAGDESAGRLTVASTVSTMVDDGLDQLAASDEQTATPLGTQATQETLGETPPQDALGSDRAPETVVVPPPSTATQVGLSDRPATTVRSAITTRPTTTDRTTTTVSPSTTLRQRTQPPPSATERSRSTRSTRATTSTTRSTTVTEATRSQPTSTVSTPAVQATVPMTTPLLIEYRDDAQRDGIVSAAFDDLSLRIVDTIVGLGESTTSGVAVDAYTADGDGRRQRWVTSDRTGPDGRYRIDIQASDASPTGCYVLVFSAPTGRGFETSGQYREAHLCSPTTGADLPLVRMAEIESASLDISSTSAVFADGTIYLRGSGPTAQLAALSDHYRLALGSRRVVVEYLRANEVGTPEVATGQAANVPTGYEPLYIKGETVDSTGLLFAAETSMLQPAAETVLDDIVLLLEQHPEVRLSIEVGADLRLDERPTQALLHARAEAVIGYLEAVGVERRKFDVQGVAGDLDGRRFYGHAYSNQLGFELRFPDNALS